MKNTKTILVSLVTLGILTGTALQSSQAFAANTDAKTSVSTSETKQTRKHIEPTLYRGTTKPVATESSLKELNTNASYLGAYKGKAYFKIILDTDGTSVIMPLEDTSLLKFTDTEVITGITTYRIDTNNIDKKSKEYDYAKNNVYFQLASQITVPKEDLNKTYKPIKKQTKTDKKSDKQTKADKKSDKQTKASKKSDNKSEKQTKSNKKSDKQIKANNKSDK